MSPSVETGGRESLAELWSDFLERESESGSVASGRAGRTTLPRSPSMASHSGVMSPASEKGGLFSPRPSVSDGKRKESGAGLGLGRVDSSGSGR